jgi:CHAT domain-containing protein
MMWPRFGSGKGLATRGAVTLGVLGLAAFGTNALLRSRATGRDAVSSLVEAVGERRLVEGRLGGGFGFGPRVNVRARTADPKLMTALARAHSRAQIEPSSQAKHSLALALLMIGENDPALEILKALVADEPASASLLSDLSAVYLTEAPRRAHYYPEALEAAEGALERSPENVAALFNLATALEGLGLRRAATEAWRKTEQRSGGGWSEEARRHRERLEAGAPPRRNTSYRDLDNALAEGETSDESWLLNLRNIVEELSALTGDSGIRELGAPGPFALREWRRILGVYGLARRDYSSLAWAKARRNFRAFLDAAPRGLSLRQWAEAYDAILESRIGDKRQAIGRLHGLLALAIPPGLRGRCLWTLGLAAQDAGDYGLALRHHEGAQESFASSREADYEMAIRGQISNVLDLLGRSKLAWESMVSLLQAPGPDDSRRVATLGRTAEMALAQNLARTAERAAEEALRTGEEIGSDELAVVHITLARVAAARSRGAEVVLELSRARARAERIKDPGYKGRVETEIAVSEAELQSLGHLALPAEASLPSRLVESRETGRLFPLTVARALGLMRQGDHEGAQAAFRTAITQIEETTSPERLRISLGKAVIAAPFEHLIAASFDRDEHWEALSLVERLNGLRRLGRPHSLDGARLRAEVISWAEKEQVTVLFPLSDRLLVWKVSPRSVQGVGVPLGRRDLEKWAEAARRAVQAGRPLTDDRISRILRNLLGSLEPSRTRRPTVRVWPHGSLTHAPFNALLAADGAAPAETPIVEVYSSLLPTASVHRSRRASIHVFSPGRVNGKSFLPAAAAEARQVAAFYKNAVLHLDQEATPGAFDRALPSARVVHFAGHASQNEAHPETSSLWMADALHGNAVPVRLADIRKPGLDGLPLLYLSACSAGLTSGEAGFAGSSLADLFLEAGVQAVVAPITEIDDSASAAIAEQFHRAYADGAHAAGALHSALALAGPAIRPKGVAYEVFTRKTRAARPSTD